MKSIFGIDSDDPANTFPARNTFDSFNPRGILEYAVTDDHRVYASVAEGNKPGGFNDNANRDSSPIVLLGGEQLPFFEEEEAWTYEVGLKASWLNNRLRTNLSVYYSDVDNSQLTQTYSFIRIATNDFQAGARISRNTRVACT